MDSRSPPYPSPHLKQVLRSYQSAASTSLSGPPSGWILDAGADVQPASSTTTSVASGGVKCEPLEPVVYPRLVYDDPLSFQVGDVIVETVSISTSCRFTSFFFVFSGVFQFGTTHRRRFAGRRGQLLLKMELSPPGRRSY